MENPVTNTPSTDIARDNRGDGSEAIIRGAGIYPIPGRAVVRVVGDDRVSFFHGMCSADIKAASAGSVVPALFLTEHAHVIADFFAWVGDNALMVEIDAGAWTRARGHLERLIVADDVEFEEQPDLAVLDIEGPRAIDAVRAVAGDEAASVVQWRHVRVKEMTVANIPRFGAPAFTILAPRADADRIVAMIESLGTDFRRVSEAATEIIRIENGIAAAGIDTTDKTIALEARMNRAISFNKGCYLGQETIERATARGGLKKRLYGLRFAGGRIPSRDSAAMLAGKEVGRVTSAVLSPRFGAIGLAILHHSAWSVGTALAISDAAGEIAATVSELPFA